MKPTRAKLQQRFQSTPLPTGRSDARETYRQRHQPGFNPRPSQPEGATSWLLPLAFWDRVSIHAPPNRKERPYLRDNR